MPCGPRTLAGKQSAGNSPEDHGPRPHAGGEEVKVFTVALLASLRPAFAADQAAAPIRFADATAQSGIQFTHSFGAEKLGSLLESTGAGCVWFDYNNDGKPDLFVVSGRPLEREMQPYPLRHPPAVTPHN